MKVKPSQYLFLTGSELTKLYIYFFFAMINLLALLMLISQVDYQEEIRNEKLKNEEINKSNYEKNNKIQQRQNNSKIQSENHRNRRNFDTSKHIHMTTQSPALTQVL